MKTMPIDGIADCELPIADWKRHHETKPLCIEAITEERKAKMQLPIGNWQLAIGNQQ